MTRAAEILKVRRATLSAFLNGKAALSPEMGLRIEKAFGVNMDMLLKDASIVRRLADSGPRGRYRRFTLRGCLEYSITRD